MPASCGFADAKEAADVADVARAGVEAAAKAVTGKKGVPGAAGKKRGRGERALGDDGMAGKKRKGPMTLVSGVECEEAEGTDDAGEWSRVGETE